MQMTNKQQPITKSVQVIESNFLLCSHRVPMNVMMQICLSSVFLLLRYLHNYYSLRMQADAPVLS